MTGETLFTATWIIYKRDCRVRIYEQIDILLEVAHDTRIYVAITQITSTD